MSPVGKVQVKISSSMCKESDGEDIILTFTRILKGKILKRVSTRVDENIIWVLQYNIHQAIIKIR